MASVSLTFKKTQTLIDSITVDATISETHTLSAEITDHPVEKGADISDHYRKKPDILQIEGLVSNTPIPEASAALQRHLSGTVQFDSRGQFVAERGSTAYQQLLDLADNATQFDVVTSVRSYDNMMLKDLVIPRDAKIGQTLKFSATLKQVTTVSNKEVIVDTKAKPKKDLGKKATTTAPEAEKRGSTLKKLADTKVGDTLLKALGSR